MPIVGYYVQALQNGVLFNKGDTGIVDNVWIGLKGSYVGINLNGIYIGPSLSECWTVIPKPSRRRILK